MRRGWLLVLVMLSGCATTWHHPTKTRREFYQDKSKCAAQAGQAAGPNDPYAIVWSDVFRSCMYGEGWSDGSEDW